MAQAVVQQCAVGVVAVADIGGGCCAACLGHGLRKAQEFVASGVDLVGSSAVFRILTANA